MNFNSIQFLVFFTTVLMVYCIVEKRSRTRDVFLLAASYFFYMSWSWKYAGLMIFSTAIDYGIGCALGRENRPTARKTLLITSLVVNLGLLAVFKYYNFFIDCTEDTLNIFGFHPAFLRSSLLLPVGISFYTFQTLSYTIDVYRRHIEPERDAIRFAVFVSFFPQLVAGPIVRAADFLPQLKRGPHIDEDRFQTGLSLVFQGLIKKVLIADLLATLLVDDVFANPRAFSGLEVLLALYGYAFQIYNDFSGYSDIAIGCSRMLGFDIPQNFNQPYLAASPREFWTRWHISLSGWLRDYLYIPLGGSRKGDVRTGWNLMATMLLGGLWHGAATNFVLWGAYHGALLTGTHFFMKDYRPSGVRLWRDRIICFHLVLFGWLLFRVGNMDQFVGAVSRVASFSLESKVPPLFFAVLSLGIISHLISEQTLAELRLRWSRLPAPLLGTAYAGLLLLFCGAAVGTPAFIYFQF